MRIGIPREAGAGERRVPVIPEGVARLAALGAEVVVERGLGESIRVADADYEKAGARVEADRSTLLRDSRLVLRLGVPSPSEAKEVGRGGIHISHLDPFRAFPVVKVFRDAGVSAMSMEMIPRSTIAQKMDALSSQASLAGYAAVLLAAERLDKILPMMITPSGTLTPARVFVIGAGVAGLQAIATAKRLGARVEAFDTRPVVEEQVLSLGAKFVKIDLGEVGQTQDGYARELTPEQLRRQREQMARHCAAADIVITTAALFGRPAPVIVTRDMVAGMKPGSVIVDMAVETGGNVEGSRPGEDVEMGGVRILGAANLPGRVPAAASQMYSANVVNVVAHFWDAESKAFVVKREDEIMARCLVTHDGAIVNEAVRAAMDKQETRS